MENKEKRMKIIKEIIVNNLRLKISPDEIGDDQPLFAKQEGSLQLDSVEALEILSGIEDKFGFEVTPGENPKEDFFSAASLLRMIERCESSDECESA